VSSLKLFVYHIYLNVKQPSSQSSVFREMPVLQNLYNFVHEYKITPCFSNDDLAKNSCHISENAVCHLVPPQIEN
jgi:hypothetical protein